MKNNRCQQCVNCLQVGDVQKILLVKKYNNHYTQSDVEWWNKTLKENPCANLPQDQGEPK